MEKTTTLRSKWLLSIAVMMIASGITGCVESASKQAYRKGFAYHVQYENAEAIVELSSAISQDANHVEYYYARGLTYLEQDNYDSAIADFSKAVELAPNFINPYFRRAQAYARQRRYKEAIADCNKVLQICPSASEAYSSLSKYYTDSGDSNKALEMSKLLATVEKDEKETFDQLYDAATEAKDQEKRIWACNQSLRFPQNFDHNAYHQLGLVYCDQGKFEKAIEDFSAALKNGGSEGECTYQRGLAQARLNHNSEAWADFDKCVKLKNNNEIGHYVGARGVAAYFLGKYGDAISDLTKAIELDRKDCRYRAYYKYRAMAFDKKGLKDLAKKDQENFAKTPQCPPNWYNPLPQNWRVL